METILRTNHISTSHGVHKHDHPQILIGYQGLMRCELPNARGAIARGGFGVMPSEVEHRFEGASDRCRLLVIDIDMEDPFITALEAACLSPAGARLLDRPELIEPTGSMLGLLDWADVQLRQGKHTSSPAFQYQLISAFLTQLMMQGEESPGGREKFHRVDKHRLDSYIDKRLHRSIDNEELANLCHVSPSYLYIVMRQLFGTSPQQYIAGRRMNQACLLVQSRKASLAEVAERLGFADGASFSRAYRRHFGYPPSRTPSTKA